jgi:hypothetical protein
MTRPDDPFAAFDEALDDLAPPPVAPPPVAEALDGGRFDDETLDDDEARGRWEGEGARAPLPGLVVPDLDRWTVQAVAGRLRARLHAAAEAKGSHLFAWPGMAAAWPEDHGEIIARDVYPHPSDAGDAWGSLWQLLGPPRPDWLAVVVGRPGRGKSGWSLQTAVAAAVAGAPVVYMSCEMGDDELLARALAVRSGGRVPWRSVMRGAVPDDELAEAVAELDRQASDLAGPCLYLWAPPKRERNLDGLRAFVEAVAARHGRPVLVVVDYVQRLGDDENDRRVEILKASGALRDLSRPAENYPGAAVLAISSTARGYYPRFANCPALLRAELGGFVLRPKPGNNDLVSAAYEPGEGIEGTGKETGELEYDASVVIALTCDSDADEVRVGRTPLAAENRPIHGIRAGLVVVAKNRAGPTGWAPMTFHAPTGRWADWPSSRWHYLSAIGRRYVEGGPRNGELQQGGGSPRDHALPDERPAGPSTAPPPPRASTPRTDKAKKTGPADVPVEVDV